MGFTVKGQTYLEHTAKISDVVVINETNESGYCTFKISNHEFSEYTSINSMLYKTITVEDYTGVEVFSGEIKKIKYDFSTWETLVSATGILEKLKNQKVYHNPITDKGRIYSITNLGIIPTWYYDYDESIPNNINQMLTNEYQNDFVTVTDNSTTQQFFTIDFLDSALVDIIKNSDQSDYSASVSYIGSFDDIVYDDGVHTYNAGGEYTVYKLNQTASDDFLFEIDTQINICSNSTSSDIDTIAINFAGRVGYKSKYGQLLDAAKHPRMYIYDYALSSWEEIIDFFDDVDYDQTGFDANGWQDAWTGTNQNLVTLSNAFSRKFLLKLQDLSKSAWDDYLNTVENAGNNYKRSFKIKISCGGDSYLLGPAHAITIYKIGLEVNYTTDKLMEYSVRKISSNTTNKLVLDTTGVTDATGFPLTDNWSIDDPIVVTPPLSTIVSDVWNSFAPSGWNISFATNNDVSISRIIEKITLWEFINLACDMSNYEFYYEKVGLYHTLVCKETLDSSGVTLSKSNISNIEYMTDASKLRKQLFVFGSYNATATKTLTPEVSSVTYDNTYLYNADLVSSGQALVFADSKAHEYENVQRTLSCIVRYNTGADFSSLLVGRTVIVNVSEIGLSNETLFIKRIEYFSSGQTDYVRLFLQKKFV